MRERYMVKLDQNDNTVKLSMVEYLNDEHLDL
jgi:hypothetical protein